MNKNWVAIVLLFITHITTLSAITLETTDQQSTRLFWDTSTTIDKETFEKFLVLVNKIIELKLENELFVGYLRDFSHLLKSIDTDLEAQAILKGRIDTLIKALSNRSQNEINDVAFLRALFSSLGINSTKVSNNFGC